jgi:transposase
MIYITTEDMRVIQDTAATIWRNLESFTGEDREKADAFCRYSRQLETRYQEEKERHRVKMEKYRKDPKTADKVREYAREAQRRFRAKKKAEKEH